MNLKKIIIHNNEILFNILNEIKENYNFELINLGKKDPEHFEESSDFLIISNKDNNNKKNFLVLKKFPIRINELIQIINIQFLKNRFNFQSDIEIGLYQLNLNSREMKKKNLILHLTEREIKLIIFISESENPIKIDQLQKHVWEYNFDLDTHTVETHIYRLRKKIKEKFNDENFIISSDGGYIIK